MCACPPHTKINNSSPSLAALCGGCCLSARLRPRQLLWRLSYHPALAECPRVKEVHVPSRALARPWQLQYLPSNGRARPTPRMCYFHTCGCGAATVLCASKWTWAPECRSWAREGLPSAGKCGTPKRKREERHRNMHCVDRPAHGQCRAVEHVRQSRYAQALQQLQEYRRRRNKEALGDDGTRSELRALQAR